MFSGGVCLGGGLIKVVQRRNLIIPTPLKLIEASREGKNRSAKDQRHWPHRGVPDHEVAV